MVPSSSHYLFSYFRGVQLTIVATMGVHVITVYAWGVGAELRDCWAEERADLIILFTNCHQSG